MEAEQTGPTSQVVEKIQDLIMELQILLKATKVASQPEPKERDVKDIRFAHAAAGECFLEAPLGDEVGLQEKINHRSYRHRG